MPDALVGCDDAGTIVVVNAEAERVFGWGRDELIGARLDILIPESHKSAHSADVDAFLDKPGFRPMSSRPVLSGLRRDGSQFPAEISLSWVRTEAGNLALAAVRDITERLEATRLAALVESSDDAILGKTMDGVIITWNPACERLYGFTAIEAIGQPVSALLLPADEPDDIAEILAKLRAGERVGRYEARRRHKDGTVLEVSLAVSPIRDSSGQLVGASTIARDVSVISRRMRDAARLAAIVESSEDAIMGVSTEWVLTSWNSAAERMYGYTAEEALGRTPESLLIPAGRRDEAAELYERVRNGESLIGIPVRRWRKDGSPVDVSLTISPILDPSGRMMGASAIARDITKDLEGARELEAAEARYRTLVEQVPAIIYDWGFQGDLHHTRGNYVSPQIEAVLGFTPREAIADPQFWLVRLHPDDRVRVEAETIRLIEGAAPLTIEFRMLAKDGHPVALRSQAVVLERDEHGKPSRIQGVVIDITAEKAAEEVLRKGAEEKTQLINLLAHELFTPITSIQGAALTLSSLGEQLSSEDLSGLAEGVAKGAARLRRLVRNLDAAARLDRGDMTGSGRMWSLGEILAFALHEFQFESDALDFNLALDQKPATRTTVVDLPLVGQAVGIVIENALDYSNGEAIDIKFEERGDGPLISVSDRGPGVPSAQRDRIFELFTQVDSSDSRGHEGMGVGLFLARRVMRLHGGDLEYEARPDGGSIFTFCFLPAESAA